MTHVVAIVPAYNRADTVGATVTALRTIADVLDIIVVDDGSRDRTAAQAAAAGARVIELARNHGKGGAVAAGIAASGAPEIYLLIDADLGETAGLAGALLEPVRNGESDMTVAVFGLVAGRSGFGFVKGFAARVLRAQTGQLFTEPLSGQRAVRGSLLRSLELAEGFGLEIGLALDSIARGASITEIEVPFEHLPSGRDLSGFVHRIRIGQHMYRAVADRIGWPKTVYCLALSVVDRFVSRTVTTARPARHGFRKAARQRLQQVRHLRPLRLLQPRLLLEKLKSWRRWPWRRRTSSES